MTCFNPNQGYESSSLTVNRKHSFTYSKKHARRVNGVLVRRTVPCKKCEGCRFDYSREWCVKIMHEAMMHSHVNSFVTLTYNDALVPAFGQLKYKEHFTPFLKRLRERIAPLRIRFYMIGELGDLNLRPHFHVIIFGFDFPDKVPFKSAPNGEILYRSKLLEDLWKCPDEGVSFGYSSIGSVTPASAAYVARYSMKKQIGMFDGYESFETLEGEIITRPKLSERYLRYHPIDDEFFYINPERAYMSNGGGKSKLGGIGKTWFDKFRNDLYPKDFTHLSNGILVRPPKYYDKLLERVDPVMLESIKQSRMDHMAANVNELTVDRLRQKRVCLLGKLSKLKRNIKDVYK